MKFLRFAGRIAVAVLGVWMSLLVIMQFARLIARDVALGNELAAGRVEVRALEQRRDLESQDVARLRDPRGAIPEIHRLLGLFAPDERVIVVRRPGVAGDSTGAIP